MRAGCLVRAGLEDLINERLAVFELRGVVERFIDAGEIRWRLRPSTRAAVAVAQPAPEGK